MDPTTIRSLWRPRHGDREASVAMWDSMADDFNDHAIPSFGSDRLLRVFDTHGMLTPETDVLDVACGTGTHSFAIASRVRSTTGIDISPAMISHAQARAEALGHSEARFVVEDWMELDLAAQGMEHRFDLVFAHMTPAIDGPATFDKLSHASRNWCVLTKPTRRQDPISDRLRELLGIQDNREDGASDIAFGFGLLLQQGLQPRLEYEDTVWNRKRPLAKAKDFYLNRMRTYGELDAAATGRAEAYLDSIADAEGLVGEKTDVTLTTMYWSVDSPA